MKRQVRFLELHTDLFHAGTNFGKKIVPQNRVGLKLQWDTEDKWFEVTWKNRTGFIFTGNCAFVEFEEGIPVELPANEHQSHDVTKLVAAQVSTPHGHVFEGAGKGKAGRGAKATQ